MEYLILLVIGIGVGYYIHSRHLETINGVISKIKKFIDSF